jgi:hypothetical protein
LNAKIDSGHSRHHDIRDQEIRCRAGRCCFQIPIRVLEVKPDCVRIIPNVCAINLSSSTTNTTPRLLGICRRLLCLGVTDILRWGSFGKRQNAYA